MSHHSVTRSGETLTALSGTPAPTAVWRALLMMLGLPPMPWPMIRHLTDDDLTAVFAYLQSIPAVHNKVPEPQPPQ